MSESYPADVVSQWRKMREDFDRDPSKLNPYEEVDDRMSFSFLNYIVSNSTHIDLTMAQLRLELLKEEVSQVPSADNPPGVSAVAFFWKALDIEERL